MIASARNGIITLKTWSGLFHHAEMPFGSRDAIEAKIISEMPLPMPRWVISSPSHISSTQPAVSVMTITKTRPKVKFVDDARCPPLEKVPEEEDVADRLGEREADGQVARVLRDLLLADLALLAELVQRGHHDLQQLQDDRRRDVGHDPEREDREALQRAAREEVQEAEHVRAAEVAREMLLTASMLMPGAGM